MKSVSSEKHQRIHKIVKNYWIEVWEIIEFQRGEHLACTALVPDICYFERLSSVLTDSQDRGTEVGVQDLPWVRILLSQPWVMLES